MNNRLAQKYEDLRHDMAMERGNCWKPDKERSKSYWILNKMKLDKTKTGQEFFNTCLEERYKRGFITKKEYEMLKDE